MQIRFVSKNDFKISEVQEILNSNNLTVIAAKYSINEIQTDDVRELVKDKLLKAFQKIGRPVFVEHTGLYVDSLNGFPGGLTQIFWDKLEADKFSSLLGHGSNIGVVARTTIGYCDAKKIHFFEGEKRGKISSEPKGDRNFQWDCIFIPEGETETFAEMGNRKNEISMRKIAFDKFNHFLEGIKN